MDEKYLEETLVNDLLEAKGAKRGTLVQKRNSTQQKKKRKMTNNEKAEKDEEADEKYKEENGKWPNSLDYSLIYENKTEIIKIQDIWNDKQNGSKVRHISIRGKAGSGKNESSEDIENHWSKILNTLHIPQWDTNDAKHIMHSMNGLLLLDGFAEIANEIEKKNLIYKNGFYITLPMKTDLLIKKLNENPISEPNEEMIQYVEYIKCHIMKIIDFLHEKHTFNTNFFLKN
ncbi:hypothetical protein RFI_15332, partial [Reticulomyxa filosa]